MVASVGCVGKDLPLTGHGIVLVQPSLRSVDVSVRDTAYQVDFFLVSNRSRCTTPTVLRDEMRESKFILGRGIGHQGIHRRLTGIPTLHRTDEVNGLTESQCLKEGMTETGCPAFANVVAQPSRSSGVERYKEDVNPMPGTMMTGSLSPILDGGAIR